ncbi:MULTISPECIES: heat-inducible transcriptional repressor HrcA [unclassified Romboutsia]|uniref:heat-inducible transcriptional repressor HrcA n=1 Tax=unclassified Romboutsia TaxID=2626894 RepID=UPI000822F48B|nr:MULTISPECIES: heat-inducible transcriptional repressor HrcA [unclassified Romboutsia]SCH37146.1 Heat-inducible transcription repressor HrcA [uncultured Clostridium sp.]
MELNERKLNILKAIIKDYIDTAEAVGSRTISKKYNLGVSAATIRNEMADLEELGYLIQPHTSAGRVPTEKGYKLYVDTLMATSELSDTDKKMIEKCVRDNINHIQDLIHETSKLLSELTNYTTIGFAKNLVNYSTIKHIQLVSMNENNILLIVVTDKGDIKKETISTKVYLEQTKLNIISDNLTKKLGGKTITHLDDRFVAFIKHEIGEYSNLIDQLINALNSNLSSEELYMTLSGATNILSYPEFNDVLKARSFFNMLEEKDNITKMTKSKGILKDNTNIIIGSDNEVAEAQEYSVVTTTYKVDENSVGRISFIGPTRMDYSRIYSIISYINLLINNKK